MALATAGISAPARRVAGSERSSETVRSAPASEHASQSDRLLIAPALLAPVAVDPPKQPSLADTHCPGRLRVASVYSHRFLAKDRV